jgi:hypothetical protein
VAVAVVFRAVKRLALAVLVAVEGVGLLIPQQVKTALLTLDLEAAALVA